MHRMNKKNVYFCKKKKYIFTVAFWYKVDNFQEVDIDRIILQIQMENNNIIW